jgi:hypothetical protein
MIFWRTWLWREYQYTHRGRNALIAKGVLTADDLPKEAADLIASSKALRTQLVCSQTESPSRTMLTAERGRHRFAR